MKVEQVAIKAIKKAGAIVIQNINKIETVALKERNDYVTNVDLAAEDVIKDVIREYFPDHSFFAEESGKEIFTSEYTWFIDPLSSTRNYIHGLPHFAVVVALQKNTEFVFGTVFDPFFDELFFAEKGKGAYLNDRQITVSSTERLSNSLLSIIPKNKGDFNKKNAINLYAQVLPHISSVRRFGSVALELCYIASGRIDGQIMLTNDIFSLPAGILILQEAGGMATDQNGDLWNTNSSSLIASNGKIHHQILQIVKSSV